MELTERVRKAREYEEALYGELRDDPIDLDALFDAVVKTVHFNYVGYEQKKEYFNPAEYHTYVFSHYRYRSLTVEMLVRSLHQFVGDMHDRNLTFHCDDWIDYRNVALKYRVRAARDVLYVTQADPQTGLTPGDRILEIQGLTPDRVRRLTRNNCFFSRLPERELWGGYLRMAGSLTVEHADGSRETLRMKQFPLAEETASLEELYPISFSLYQGTQLIKSSDADDSKDMKLETEGSPTTSYIRMERMDAAAVTELCSRYENELADADKLILDLRRCIGGEEGAGWDLFPLLLDHEASLSDLIADEGSYVLCTRNNCDARLSLLRSLRETVTAPDQALILEEQIRFYEENYGKGMVFARPDPIEDEKLLPASKAPAKVLILLDTFCEKEGEQFAAMCKRCGSKVRIIGRPSMGTLDYFDQIRLEVHDHMTLSYPIRMTKAAYEGRGISEKGIPTDVYIPWTPEEIRRDVLLELALEA